MNRSLSLATACVTAALCTVSTEGADDLIDPLSDNLELDPVWAELKGRELIFHGADYDLRLLRKDFDYSPCSVFDTMIAARLIGCEKFGLANLVEQFLVQRLHPRKLGDTLQTDHMLQDKAHIGERRGISGHGDLLWHPAPHRAVPSAAD